MTQGVRKPLGIVLTLMILVIYCIFAVALHLTWIVSLPIWAQLIYFSIAGLGWVFPAGVIIKWMARPDEPVIPD